MLRDGPSDGVWWPEQRAQEKGQLSWPPAARKRFAEEAFELRLVVLAGVSQVTVGKMGKSEGIHRCRKA